MLVKDKLHEIAKIIHQQSGGDNYSSNPSGLKAWGTACMVWECLFKELPSLETQIEIETGWEQVVGAASREELPKEFPWSQSPRKFNLGDRVHFSPMGIGIVHGFEWKDEDAPIGIERLHGWFYAVRFRVSNHKVHESSLEAAQND